MSILSGILKGLGAVGSIAAAPVTGGASLTSLPSLLSIGAAGLGGLLENTKGARTSTSTVTPTLSPEYKTLSDLLRARAEDRLRSSADLSGYTAQGIGNINQAYGGVQQALNNNLTARGLATSPVAGNVDTQLQLARGGNIADYLNTIPLLQRQMQSEDMAAALPVLGLGRGQESTGVGAGSALGGGFTSAAEMLAYLQGRGALNGAKPGIKTPPFSPFSFSGLPAIPGQI